MIALYIIAGIVLLIAILLNCPIRAEISYLNKELNITVKYLFFTLFPVKEKKISDTEETTQSNSEKETNIDNDEKKSAEENTDTSEDDSSQTDTDSEKKLTREEKKRIKEYEKRRKKREKEDLGEKIELIKMLISSSGKGVKKLLKSIRIYDVALDIDVADEDAYEAALGYGRMNIVVYNAISFLRTFFTLTIEHINISCIYNSSESRFDAALKIYLNPAKALGAGISIAFAFFVKYIKRQNEIKKSNKATQKHAA